MTQFKTKAEHEAEPTIKAIFHVSVPSGVLKINQEGTQAVLEEILKQYNTKGVTIHTAKGFTWFPINSVNHIDVEIL